MKRQPKYLLVADLELTCWENETPPEGERSEIIEIGYCRINLATLTREEPVSVKVRPQSSRVSAYCTELTGWTTKALKSGQPLQDACKTLIYKRGLRQYPWFSWGNDADCLKEQTAFYGAEYPLSGQHFDLSALYSILLGQPFHTGQSAALKHLGIEARTPAHVGAIDAYNAAGILIALIQKTRFTLPTE